MEDVDWIHLLRIGADGENCNGPLSSIKAGNFLTS
jgi:hypothetical protein